MKILRMPFLTVITLLAIVVPAGIFLSSTPAQAKATNNIAPDKEQFYYCGDRNYDNIAPNSSAQNSNEYYDYTYTVKIDQTAVSINEGFIAHVRFQGTCKKDLPVNIRQGIISVRISARLQQQPATAVLNNNFQFELDNIPADAGLTFEKDTDVPLTFSTGSQPGIYDLIGQTIGAKFLVMAFWVDGMSYLPSEPIMVGTIELKDSGFGFFTNNPSATANPTSTLVNTIRPSEIEASAPVAGTPAIASNSPVTGIPGEDRGIWQPIWLMAAGLIGLGCITGLVLWRVNIHDRGRTK